jgi:hypothetical protein
MINKVVTEEAAKSSGIISTFPKKDNKRYEGTRLEDGEPRVTVTSSSGSYPLLFPAGEDENGIEWGFPGHGPGNLAQALAYNVFSAYEGSLYHQLIGEHFKTPIYLGIVTRLQHSGWVLHDHEIIEVVRNSIIKDPDRYTTISMTARRIVSDYVRKPEQHNVSAENIAMFAISVDTEIRSYLENMLRLPETAVDIILDPFEHWDPECSCGS